jgi:hypothetical protein
MFQLDEEKSICGCCVGDKPVVGTTGKRLQLLVKVREEWDNLDRVKTSSVAFPIYGMEW